MVAPNSPLAADHRSMVGGFFLDHSKLRKYTGPVLDDFVWLGGDLRSFYRINF